MPGILDQTAEGITTNTNGRTCKKPAEWDKIITIAIALIVTEIIVIMFFAYFLRGLAQANIEARRIEEKKKGNKKKGSI
ncbi:hypothetical protein L204_102834 [Cryptococcus depauperatus]